MGRIGTWIAAGLALGGAAAAQEMEFLYGASNWVVSFSPAAGFSQPQCGITAINLEDREQSLSLVVMEPDAAWISLVDQGWAGTVPGPAPHDLSVDDETVLAGLPVVGGTLEATIGAIEILGPLQERLAGGSVLRLSDAEGATLLEMDLAGNVEAFAALQDCVASRLDVAAE